MAEIVLWEAEVNKTQLIDALAERLGDKKIAAAAVAGLVDVVVRTVNGGDKVTITGFGIFEKRARAARMARNPRTGQSVKVKKTNVPTFRPGTLFREVVSGARKLPRVSASTIGTGMARPAASTTSPFRASEAPAVVMQAAPGQETTIETEVKASTKAANATKAAAKAAKAASKAAKATKQAKKESKIDKKATTTVTAKKAVKKPAI
ncbi:MAG: HU family DNA-binding protein [Actinomycetota bacterium]|nr:HU family DNA-binding protein [Actinomycetota bacterium]